MVAYGKCKCGLTPSRRRYAADRQSVKRAVVPDISVGQTHGYAQLITRVSVHWQFKQIYGHENGRTY